MTSIILFDWLIIASYNIVFQHYAGGKDTVSKEKLII